MGLYRLYSAKLGMFIYQRTFTNSYEYESTMIPVIKGDRITVSMKDATLEWGVSFIPLK